MKFRVCLLSIPVAGLLMLATTSVKATTFTVTNTNNSGPGSLRATIDSANADASATANSPHIIDATGISGTINLTSELPAFGWHVMLNGPGASTLTVTRNSATDFRIFWIGGARTVVINGLTVSNGAASNGGGILNVGTLTLNGVTVSDNSADDGGGIYNANLLFVNNSTISGNTADDAGGGIHNVMGFKVFTVNNTTISGNTANRGGGIYNFGIGNVNNSTITENSASNGGGAYNELNFHFNPPVRDSAVIYYNTIIAGNSATTSGPDAFGLVDSKGHNLIGNSSGCFVVSVLEDSSNTGDQIGTSSSPIDPMLGGLANNGGPTYTHALLSGSPALDAGDNTDAPSTDQRGEPRIVDYDCDGTTTIDIGAYESPSFDTQAPTLAMPSDITIECDESTEPSNTGSATADDDNDSDPDINHTDVITEGSCGNSYTITRTWTAVDYCGNTASENQIITVQDSEAPGISLSSTSIVLSPPNHDYETIDLSDFVTAVSDNCSTLEADNVRIISVTSDEPDDINGGSDGNTTSDVVIASDCQSVQVRRERNATSNGRVYRINVQITDGCGNIGSASIAASVPKGSAAAVEGSVAYTINSTCTPLKLVSPGSTTSPHGFYLAQNSPNPFNPSTIIEYGIAVDGPVRLTVTDEIGRSVATLVDKPLAAGVYTVSFNSNELSSGTYYYVLESNGERLVGMMTLTK